jgi:hypothetical protein
VLAPVGEDDSGGGGAAGGEKGGLAGLLGLSEAEAC